MSTETMTAPEFIKGSARQMAAGPPGYYFTCPMCAVTRHHAGVFVFDGFRICPSCAGEVAGVFRDSPVSA